MTNVYRTGPVGALMDEYERAARHLKELLRTIGQDQFIKIVDTETSDPDCRSIQTIADHVVKAGYGYANYIRKQFGDSWTERKESYLVPSPELSCIEIDNMLAYTLESLEGKWDLTFEEALQNKMKTSWGQEFDFEQLLEHAIVHILRHRRQIEKFLSQTTQSNP